MKINIKPITWQILCSLIKLQFCGLNQFYIGRNGVYFALGPPSRRTYVFKDVI